MFISCWHLTYDPNLVSFLVIRFAHTLAAVCYEYIVGGYSQNLNNDQFFLFRWLYSFPTRGFCFSSLFQLTTGATMFSSHNSSERIRVFLYHFHLGSFKSAFQAFLEFGCFAFFSCLSNQIPFFHWRTVVVKYGVMFSCDHLLYFHNTTPSAL